MDDADDRDGAEPVEDVLVRSLVHRPAVYVQPDATLRRLAVLLTEEAIGAALVRGPYGAEGLVSERDVVQAVADGADPDQVRVVEVMAEELVTVAPTDHLVDAVLAMLDADVRHLPVVENGVHYGMISARDALRAFADHLRRS